MQSTTNATGSTTKEFVEPEEQHTSTTPNATASNINPDFDPVVDEAPEMRDYAKGNINPNDPNVAQPIPEQTFKFQAPPVGPNAPGAQQQQQQQGPKPEPKPVNPAMEELPKKEQEQATEYMCELIYHNYALGKEFINKQIKISDKRVNKMERKGEIDLSVPVPFGRGVVPASQLINAFNREMDGVIGMSPEFRERTEPVLKRILMKRGIGLTDEQYLGVLVIQDLAQTAGLAMRGISQRNEMLNVLKESLKMHKAGQSVQGPVVTPQASTPAPEASKQKQENMSSSQQETKSKESYHTPLNRMDGDGENFNDETDKFEIRENGTIIINNPNTMMDQMNQRKQRSHIATQQKPQTRGPKRGSGNSSRPPSSKGTGQRGRQAKHKNDSQSEE